MIEDCECPVHKQIRAQEEMREWLLERGLI